MLKKVEKIHLSLKEFRVGYFLVVLFLGLCSCRNSSEKITSLSPSNVEIPNETLNNSSFAKTKGLDLVKSFQTNNFQIFIYNKKDKLYYYGIRKTGNRDSLFLSANYQEGIGYVAVNKGYKYIINDSYLSVYKGETLLRKKPVIK